MRHLVINIKKQIARLPLPFWLSFYIFMILVAVPVLAYLGTFGSADTPSVETGNISYVGSTSAVLNGKTSPAGLTERGFRYGISTNYDHTKLDTNTLNYGYLGAFGQYGSDNGQFNEVSGVDIDSFGNIFVVDTGN